MKPACGGDHPQLPTATWHRGTTNNNKAFIVSTGSSLQSFVRATKSNIAIFQRFDKVTSFYFITGKRKTKKI